MVPWDEPRYLTIAQAAGRDLLLRPDDPAGCTQSETYSSRPCRVSVPLAALGGDDGGDALLLEPAEEPPQFGAQDGVVGQAAEQRLQRVEHDALGADGVNRMAQPDEQSFEVVLAGLLDLAALDVNVVDRQLLLRDQVIEIEAERTRRFCQFLGGLLEGHEHARLIVLHGAAHEEFDCQQRLAAARAAAHQGGPPLGNPPPVISSRP